MGLLVALAYMAAFGKTGIFVQLASMLTANVLIVYTDSIREAGFSAFLNGYVLLVKSFGVEVTAAVSELEVHDLTFAIGLYLLYFLLKREKVRFRAGLILITAVFFTVGLKRIAVAALLGSLILTAVLRLFPEEIRKKVIQIVGYLVIVCAVSYIVIVKLGLYERAAEYWNIHTKGRLRLNHLIDPYYSLSPLFGGQGLGFVSRFFTSPEMLEYSKAGALHNDYLRMYIEIGFWGYLAWLWVSWGYKLYFFCTKRGSRAAAMVFAVFSYCFITYLTDNTYYYFYTNLAAFSLILSCEFEERPKTEGKKGGENYGSSQQA